MNNNNKLYTILETMNNKQIFQENNHNHNLKHCSCNGNSNGSDNYKQKDKWNKYIKKIDNIILNKIESMCLIERNNISRKYSSNIDNSYIDCEYRFKGIPNKSYCTIKFVCNDIVVYEKSKKTPKKLYKKFVKFINEYYTDTYSISDSDTQW